MFLRIDTDSSERKVFLLSAYEKRLGCNFSLLNFTWVKWKEIKEAQTKGVDKRKVEETKSDPIPHR